MLRRGHRRMTGRAAPIAARCGCSTVLLFSEAGPRGFARARVAVCLPQWAWRHSRLRPGPSESMVASAPRSVSVLNMMTGTLQCPLAHRLQCGQPIHHRHLDVQRDDVGRNLVRSGQGDLPVGGVSCDLQLGIASRSHRTSSAASPPNRPPPARGFFARALISPTTATCRAPRRR